MRISNFSARIPQGREHASGHVALEHGQTYTLALSNHWHDRDCDAEVSIDGKSLGAFRIGKGDTLTLERSSNDQGRFTFFKADSAEGQAAGAAELASNDRGLVTVRFRPGYPIRRVFPVLRGVAPTWPTSPSPYDGGLNPTWTCSTDSARYGSVASTNSSIQLESMRGMEAGVTGLTGHSDQSFYDVAALTYDPAEEVTITLRLVRESVATVRKLEPVRANPVPAAV